MDRRRNFQLSASDRFTLSSSFIQDHDHCWKLGAVEQLLCGERTMHTGHTGMSSSIITAC